ncbi:MAG: tRNA (N6-isopentenyl adenosine(37)-C2)-methylthiotransferase MiaB [Bifidobacteriaceae bacterium]|nr:tRNA (N6-isopentenyl adenosine(37)-C2)-methylthiotransferase MiaB [Bifidobacteriaceae bacterium]
MNEDMMTLEERSLAPAAAPAARADAPTVAPKDAGATSETTRGKGLYYVHTLGCQMNAHDSERISGVLAEKGYVLATEDQVKSKDLDLIVLNTCAVRENATERMYGTLGQWANLKRHNPRLQIAVGGCMAQKDRDRIAKRAPWVDAVFGTKNIASLPGLLDEARNQHTSQVEISEDLSYFPSQLPVTRASRTSAWVSISMGCNNTCTFCIVPSVRGRERDRRPGDILSEIQRTVSAGAKEVTLLGQNVNSFGYSTGDRMAFSRLLRACGRIEGLERVRFTSPHPAAFSDDVIEAMAETPNVMHQLHMPLQSGSDRVLRAMRRSYRTKRFMEILGKVRAAMPDAQVTTDIIVGFPGETEEDFQETMDVVRRARFSSAYIFEYSPRPGTPAASMEQVDPKVVSDRFNRLHALQEQITAEQMRTFEATTVEVMVTGEGRKDSATHRITGRERGGVLVHVGIPEGEATPKPGQFITCTVTKAASHFLLSDPGERAVDGGVYEVREHSTVSLTPTMPTMSAAAHA